MSLGADRMAIWKLAIGTTFLLQTGVGVLGNFSLLCHYLYLYCTKCRFRPTDRILQHLTVANCFVTLSKGVPETLAAFGLTHFLGDLGCKLVFYLHRVGRDVSMGTTCLLGVFQLVTISPRSSRWPGLKVKAPRYLGTSSILCWVLNLGLNITVFMNMTGRRSNQNSSKEMDLGYCYAVLQEKITLALYIPLLTSRDAMCMGVMLWASGSTVLTLHRHKQRVRHIHRSNVCPRSCPESRATRSILVLLSTFVSLSTVSLISHVYSALSKSHILWLVNVSTLVTGCFPAVSPYILLSLDSRAHWLCCAWLRTAKSPPLIGSM